MKLAFDEAKRNRKFGAFNAREAKRAVVEEREEYSSAEEQ